ncbi:hypothetical protein [Clostridium sp. B9]|uniref:hypothetical protein n=1 Tax=Clostridium sp. B9 TaxID=3423224 RepID=UPI003D2ED716
MKKVLVGGALVVSLSVGSFLGCYSVNNNKVNEKTYNNLTLLNNKDNGEDMSMEKAQEKNEDSASKVKIDDKIKKTIEKFALDYEDKMSYLDLGAKINGWKEMGNEKYYQVTLYSKSVQNDELTGAIDRVIINKSGKVLKSETGEPLTGIEGLITKLNISDKEALEIKDVAKDYEVSLNNGDIEVVIEGEKEIEGTLYYKTNLYLKSMKEKGIYAPILKLYIDIDGDVLRNLDN